MKYNWHLVAHCKHCDNRWFRDEVSGDGTIFFNKKQRVFDEQGRICGRLFCEACCMVQWHDFMLFQKKYIAVFDIRYDLDGRSKLKKFFHWIQDQYSRLSR